MPKPIVITDDSVVNSYGFRVMSDGGDLAQFLRNPILLWDHTRRYGENNKNIILPIGTMKDLHRQGSQIIGTPVFDNDDEFAKQVANKYEKDILNMSSIGFEAIEWSEDPALMLQGQTGPTITKWALKEVSITDIGANPNSCKLSHKGRVITLGEKTDPDELTNFFNSNKPENQMKKVIAVLNGSKLLTLPEASAEELVAEGVQTLVNQLGSKDQIIAQKDAEIKRLGDEAKAARTAALTDKATTLVESALSAQKIVAAQKEQFVKLASASEEGYNAVKGMLDSLKGYQPVIPQLNAGGIELPATTTAKKELFEKHMKEGTLSKLSDEQVTELYKAATGQVPSKERLSQLTGRAAA